MKTVAIIQARMGSTRLPGKVLMDIGGKPMLQHVIERAQQIQGVDQVVVATTNKPDDVAIVELASRLNVATFGGDEQDVLGRFCHAAVIHGADAIVRLTGDCPLLDPAVSSFVLSVYLERVMPVEPDEYVSNVFPIRTWPKGYDTEVFGLGPLLAAGREATLEWDREHVTPWIRRNRPTVNITNPRGNQAHLRYAVDTAEDLSRVRGDYDKLAVGTRR
jgi:spore coat polysaccharide biosynthesis protein SpsF (cytidylyltransferase family)